MLVIPERACVNQDNHLKIINSKVFASSVMGERQKRQTLVLILVLIWPYFRIDRSDRPGEPAIGVSIKGLIQNAAS
jgi:hypothetical protein